MKNISISALTQGNNIPSARFRWRQFIPELTNAGFTTIEFPANPGSYPPQKKIARPYWLAKSLSNGILRTIKSNKTDIRFIQRELLSTIITSEYLLRKPYIFDVDDAIFLKQRWGSIDKIAKKASVIICGNAFLADHFNRYGKVEILPTAIDTRKFFYRKLLKKDKQIIGWSGTSSGFKYLYSIEEALNVIMEKFPNCYLKIISDSCPHFNKLPPERIIFEKWEEKSEALSLVNFSVGIMPLEDNLWSRGKCSFKMLTYMSMGIPVVVSPVGMNNEILMRGECGYAAKSRDDWVDAISLILEKNSSEKIGLVGRKIVEKNYSLDIIAPKLIGIIKNI